MLRCVIAVVADSTTHDGPVLLLNMGIVILASCAPTGEGDLLLETIAVELVVDELGAVVRIDAQQGER